MRRLGFPARLGILPGIENGELNPRLHVVCGSKGLKEAMEGSCGSGVLPRADYVVRDKLSHEVKFMTGSELEWKSQS